LFLLLKKKERGHLIDQVQEIKIELALNLLYN